jgi:Uma2 family endonuclease
MRAHAGVDDRRTILHAGLDWICEVLSPSIARLDRAEKLRSMRAEVRHAWLVDPALRTLEVLRLERER